MLLTVIDDEKYPRYNLYRISQYRLTSLNLNCVTNIEDKPFPNEPFLKIFKVRKNVTLITPEDPYSKVEKDKYYLSSIYPNLPYFSLPLYPSGHGGYNQILRKVFVFCHNKWSAQYSPRISMRMNIFVGFYYLQSTLKVLLLDKYCRCSE